MKRKVLIALIAVVLLAITYFFGVGFLKEGNVYVQDFSVSQDGKSITLDIGVSRPIGYVRNIEVKQQQGGKMYIDCYSAFGGINGNIGAKTSYTLPLDENTSIIAIYRSTNSYEEILKKNDEGVWERVQK